MRAPESRRRPCASRRFRRRRKRGRRGRRSKEWRRSGHSCQRSSIGGKQRSAWVSAQMCNGETILARRKITVSGKAQFLWTWFFCKAGGGSCVHGSKSFSHPSRDSRPLAGCSLFRQAALLFNALTCARPGERRGARRAEFDLDRSVWRIPAERAKMRRHATRRFRGRPKRSSPRFGRCPRAATSSSLPSDRTAGRFPRTQ